MSVTDTTLGSSSAPQVCTLLSYQPTACRNCFRGQPMLHGFCIPAFTETVPILLGVAKHHSRVACTTSEVAAVPLHGGPLVCAWSARASITTRITTVRACIPREIMVQAATRLSYRRVVLDQVWMDAVNLVLCGAHMEIAFIVKTQSHKDAGLLLSSITTRIANSRQ